MTASFPIIFRILLLSGLLLFAGCKTHDAGADLVSTPITYPFFDGDTPLGKDKTEDRFIIRTISGPTEYVVEIPQAAMDYDVEVPIANAQSGANLSAKVKNPQITDRELVANMPRLDEKAREDQALSDKIIGVNSHGGPAQSPSYVMNIDKINQLYRDNNFEYALVEINNLLAFYPTDTKLYKMKGTILLKLGNYQLAQKSWERASHLAPNDAAIRKGLEYMQHVMERNKKLTLSQPAANVGGAADRREAPVAPAAMMPEPKVSAPMPQNAMPTTSYGLEQKNALDAHSRLDQGKPQQPVNHANSNNAARLRAPTNAMNHQGNAGQRGAIMPNHAGNSNAGNSNSVNNAAAAGRENGANQNNIVRRSRANSNGQNQNNSAGNQHSPENENDVLPSKNH